MKISLAIFTGIGWILVGLLATLAITSALNTSYITMVATAISAICLAVMNVRYTRSLMRLV